MWKKTRGALAKVWLSIAATAIISGCVAATGELGDEDDWDGELGTTSALEESLTAGFTLSGCSNAEAQKIYAAMSVLLDEVSVNYNSLLSCVSQAVLLEYRGHTPRKIVDNLASAQVTAIQCAALPPSVAGEAPISISSSKMKVDRQFIAATNANTLAGLIAHELLHNRGYNHTVNPFGTKYHNLTVNQQVRRCIETRSGNRAPHAWPGPGTPPTFSRIVGMHSNNACNCAYLRDGYATCGATDYLSGRTNTYRQFSVAPGRAPANIVGMTQTGSLVCAFYDDGFVSCGTQSGCNPVTDLDATRSPYRYTTAPGQAYTNIVGMAGDDGNNRLYAWYRDGRVSSGTSDDLDRYRALYGYDLAGGQVPSNVVEMLADGSFTCAFYRNGTVSCGTTDDLDRSRSLYSSKF